MARWAVLAPSAILKKQEWPDPRGWAPSKSIIEKSQFQSGGQWARPREAGQARHYWFPQGEAKRSRNDWCNPGEGNRVWNDWCLSPVGTQSRRGWATEDAERSQMSDSTPELKKFTMKEQASDDWTDWLPTMWKATDKIRFHLFCPELVKQAGSMAFGR